MPNCSGAAVREKEIRRLRFGLYQAKTVPTQATDENRPWQVRSEFTANRIYINRITGGDRDHRHPRWNASAGAFKGQRESGTELLYQ